MKKLLFIPFFLLFTVMSYAQESVLSKVSSAVNGMPAFKAEFTISSPTPYGTVVSYSGDMTVKGTSYILTIPQMQIYSDGIDAWYYTPDRDEVVIESAQNNGEAFGSPISLMSLSDEDFKTESAGDGMVTVVPKYTELAAAVSKVELYYDVKTFLPRNVRLFSTDGSVLDFRLDKITAANITDTSVFRFDTSKVKEVIDFR